MKRNSFWIALIALCTLVLAAACQPIAPDAPFDDGHAGSATSSFDIEGTGWLLTGILQDGELVEVPAELGITVDFGADGMLSSKACNNISASFVADGTMLTIQPGAMTLMACDGPLGEIEGIYVQHLGNVASHDVTDNVLSLIDADGNVLLTFVLGVPSAGESGSAALDGTNWILTDYGMDNTVTAVPEEVAATASFNDGQLSAQVCNVIGAPYAADASAISFGPAISTMMFCDEPLMSIEMAFLAALENAATYTNEDGFLTILDANGSVLLGFTEDLNAGAAEAEEPSVLAGTNWQVTGYLSDGALVAPDSSFAATLDFGADGRYSGIVCNGYGGDFTTHENSIAFGPAVMTMMACPGPVGDFEPVYHSLLESAQTFVVDGNTLSLSNAAGEVVLTFAAYAPATLEGPIWSATGINNGNEAVVSLIAETSATATFANGTVSGNAGCNNYTASYVVDGNVLTVGPAASTMMFCAEPEGLMDQEAQFLAALSNSTTWEVHNGVLWLRDDTGANQLTMVQ